MSKDDITKIVNVAIIEVFIPQFMKELRPFLIEYKNNILFVSEYQREIGLPISTPTTKLSVREAEEMLSHAIVTTLNKTINLDEK